MTTDALIIKGDCLNVMAGLPDGSIDAIVTDPPYGLGFMGKNWDHSVPGEAFWREALRVAKPGCHILAAGGSRTYHRLAVAIEDAGWEIRDCIMWLYGSGFPKSLDVSKAIDKRGGQVADFGTFRDAVKEAMKQNGITRSMLQDALGNYMLSHYLTDGSQPAVPNWRDYQIIRDTVQLGEQFDDLFAEAAEREVVGQGSSAISTRKELQNNRGTVWGADSSTFDITAPSTDAAKQWQGWGTALKPAFEPFILARKPLDGTVAENVLKHGTGGINVDGCRVGTDGGTCRDGKADKPNDSWWENMRGLGVATPNAGRWPANVIHDGSDEVVGLTGIASRFFYCAKASKADRDEGCEGLDAIHRANGNKWTDQDYRVTNGERPPSAESGPRRNHHPTVKPVDLMAYLCRLITPPGGLILDPFCGSGSTGVAAMREGFNFIGIELNADYAEIARRRIDHERNKTPLFSNVI